MTAVFGRSLTLVRARTHRPLALKSDRDQFPTFLKLARASPLPLSALVLQKELLHTCMKAARSNGCCATLVAAGLLNSTL